MEKHTASIEKQEKTVIGSDQTVKSTPPPMRAATEYPPRPSTHNVQPTSFSTELEPQKSRLGLYITVGVIGILLLLLIFQVLSKSGLNAQIRQLEKENAELEEQLQAAQQNTQQVPQATNNTAPSGNTMNISYYPVRYRNDIRQQVGQLYAPSTNVKLTAVYFHGNGGSGENAEFAIFETSNPTTLSESQRPSTSKLFNASKIPINQRFAIQLDRPFELKAGKSYLFVVRPSSTNAVANIGFTDSTSTANGTMWVHALRVNQKGVELDTKPSWQTIPNSDMLLDLKTE